MPIYEYFCGDCQKTSQVIRPVHDREKDLQCKHCGHHGATITPSKPAKPGPNAIPGGYTSTYGVGGGRNE